MNTSEFIKQASIVQSHLDFTNTTYVDDRTPVQVISPDGKVLTVNPTVLLSMKHPIRIPTPISNELKDKQEVSVSPFKKDNDNDQTANGSSNQF